VRLEPEPGVLPTSEEPLVKKIKKKLNRLNKKKKGYICMPGFFSHFCDVAEVANHPQESLSKFGY
jgi:hypothetical protein